MAGPRVTLVATMLAIAALWLPGAATAHDQTPAGAKYCGQVNGGDAVSLEVFARRVSCSFGRAFARHCLVSSKLRGWHFRGEEGLTGRFALTRGDSTLWFDDAGAGAACLAR